LKPSGHAIVSHLALDIQSMMIVGQYKSNSPLGICRHGGPQWDQQMTPQAEGLGYSCAKT
jgi:hypothetical protein